MERAEQTTRLLTLLLHHPQQMCKHTTQEPSSPAPELADRTLSFIILLSVYVLGVELRTSLTPGKPSTTELYPHTLFPLLERSCYMAQVYLELLSPTDPLVSAS